MREIGGMGMSEPFTEEAALEDFDVSRFPRRSSTIVVLGNDAFWDLHDGVNFESFARRAFLTRESFDFARSDIETRDTVAVVVRMRG